MANMSMGTNAGIGSFSWMPSSEEPQPNWNTATTTP